METSNSKRLVQDPERLVEGNDMKILIACEFSGVVREAFRKKGHDAWSCDLLKTEIPGQHIVGDVLKYLHYDWDMMIAFPPCTYLCFAGIRWNTNNPKREKKTEQAIDFFNTLWNSGVEKICIENPVGVIPRRSGVKWSQLIHPWQFGHEEEKKTCLWIKNLPLLQPTKIMQVREQRIFKKSALRGPGSSKTRQQDRSRTFQGIANAMADQWG